jgi:hypothetical protein
MPVLDRSKSADIIEADCCIPFAPLCIPFKIPEYALKACDVSFIARSFVPLAKSTYAPLTISMFLICWIAAAAFALVVLSNPLVK